jgi:hypothetical protein
MNHFISAICWSLLSVEGWNSLSIHFLAASSAQAAWPRSRRGGQRQCGVQLHRCLLDGSTWNRCPDLWLASPWPGAAPGRTSKSGGLSPLRITSASTSMDSTKLIHTEGSCSSEATHHLLAQAHPGQVDVGGQQQADEQAVAARGGHRQKALAQRGGRRISHTVMPISISAMQLKNTATGVVQTIQSNISSPPHTRPMAKPLAM